MGKYIINEIYADGYERIANIMSLDCYSNYTVHFLECDEYIEKDIELEKRKVKDVLEGEMSIELVVVDEEVDNEIMHKQTIPKSSHIEAVVQVCQVIDEYSVYANSSISKNKILVEFEHVIDYEEGDKIFIKGSLEMNLIVN